MSAPALTPISQKFLADFDALRAKRGLDDATMGAALGYSAWTIQQIRAGRMIPGQRLIANLATEAAK